MKNSLFKRVGAVLLAGSVLLSGTSMSFAAESQSSSNNTAVKQALSNADIIDTSKSGSITIYKYDMTSAEAAGAYTEGDHAATGETDTELEEKLANYAVEGVEFTYLRVGDIETYSVNGGSTIELVYEIPNELREILNLNADDAVNMAADDVAYPCTHEALYHYTSEQLNEALEKILSDNNLSAKNALEAYVKANSEAVAMPLTSSAGYTYAENLELGLYIVVETAVPEEITTTVNPWFASLPFTDADGEEWLYDMTCYPKNQSGNPTLDKLVRNAHGEAADTVGEYEDYSYLVYNDDSAAGVETGDDASYVEARSEYSYGSTTTASEGDILDYILVSKLPHIESSATYLTAYTFCDTLSAGLTYNQDVKIAFYESASDAKVNNTANATAIWTNKNFEASYEYILDENFEKTGEMRLTVIMTAEGLEIINTTYSDYYMVVYYSVTVKSNALTVLGDEGNPNTVTLLWSRTSEAYYNTLEDKCVVYTFGIDLNKEFSDNAGDATAVQFVLYNVNDAYYVVASKDETEEEIYYVTGKATDEADATVFSPDETGKLIINGLEGDTYQLIEIATDAGYSLLKDPVTITICSTTETIIPSVAGTVGLEAATAFGQSINANYGGGIVDATGENVSESLGEQANEMANGRTIGKTAVYEGDLVNATAFVDGVAAAMSKDEASENARVDISIVNNASFLLPQTGGNGLYIVTIGGILAMAVGIAMMLKKRPSKTR